MTDERQKQKEDAARLAARKGMSLVSRGLSIVAIYPDGREVKVSESEDRESIWADALRSLNEDKQETKTKYEHLQIYTDGGSRGNPGPSASGYVIMTPEDEVLEEGGEYLGITTNNQAEYQAVKLALEAAAKYNVKELNFFVDSLLVVNQLNGEFKVRNRDLWPIHEDIKNLTKHFKKVNFSHVRREFNKLADAKVNEVLDSRESD